MRLALRYIILSGLASMFLHPLFAQERCATVQYSKSLHPDYELQKVAFEKWLSQKRVAPGRRMKGDNQTIAYKIPVVVHVIHNGEPVGTGANIPDQQILSQLRVLNNDFTRQNADAVNTPAAFANIAAGLDIEFVLAKQTPEGLPANGIVRINGGRNGWTVNDNYTLKSLSYWPAEEYMNVWVCNLTDQYVGFAQHPVSDLEGLENSSTNRLTDGVVIWHRAFGSSDDGSFQLDPAFNKGRTTTHEVGHFFGLFHIWGDDGGTCTGTDYVADTPNQGNRTQGCPPHPKSDNCSDVVMFQNFLDYTDDACMNLFTAGQVERMSIVIENSPRRSSLLASPGLEEPDPLPNDIGIRPNVYPDASICSNQVTPSIEIRNYGNNIVTTTRIRFVLDGVTRETRDFPVTLDPEESVRVSFSTLTIPSGTHEISFQVLQTNGTTDSGSFNDVQTTTVVIPTFGTVPVALNFSTEPQGWITRNFDGQITWTIVETSLSDDNRALALKYFNYEDRIGEVDVFLSPVFDLSTAPAATLTFDVAHARYQSSNDRLRVVVLTNCQDVFEGTTVYDKAGDALKTAPSTTSPFTPSNQSQWRSEFIDLNAFVGMGRIQIAFIGVNDWGNNIYLDNIALSDEERHDVAVIRLKSPGFVTCSPDATPSVRIRNTGTVAVSDINFEYSVNAGETHSTVLTDVNLSVGEEKDIALPGVSLLNGENTLSLNITMLDGIQDEDDDNDRQSFVIAVDDSRDRIPLRETFEDDFTARWTVINPSPEGAMNWSLIPTSQGRSLYFNAFDNTRLGDESWLVSPVLDFSRANEASTVFDLSYRSRSGASLEVLRILVSTDCGATFNEVDFSVPTAAVSEEKWMPASEGDWNTNIPVDLTSFAGQESVRVAFVVENYNGNDLFLDNIEFFVTSDPNNIDVKSPYAVYGYNLEHPELANLHITFSLDQRQDVRFSVVNTMGQFMTDGILFDVLNQTYPLNLKPQLPPGVYFIRLNIGGKFYSTKVIVN